MATGTLYSICISPERGQLKTEVNQVRVIKDQGIENDGHAGSWGRQVTCLNLASVKKVNEEKKKHECRPGRIC